jgi:hypothetical protein
MKLRPPFIVEIGGLFGSEMSVSQYLGGFGQRLFLSGSESER